jgi:hypothetical protein
MTVKDRWALAAAIGLPLLAITAYLLWLWPRPAGNSVIAQAGPYVLSLLTGVPFVFMLTRRSGRGVLLFVYLVGGFVLLWLYALAVLCGVHGVCL